MFKLVISLPDLQVHPIPSPIPAVAAQRERGRVYEIRSCSIML